LISRNANAPAATATNAVASTAAPDSRLADLTARLRADNARLAESAQKRGGTVSPQAVPAAQAPVPAPVQQRPTGSVERAALAAIAARVPPAAPQEPAASAPLQPASYGDVTVRPIAQKPTLFPDQDAAKV